MMPMAWFYCITRLPNDVNSFISGNQAFKQCWRVVQMCDICRVLNTNVISLSLTLFYLQDRSQDCKKPQKTTVDQFMMVLVLVFEYLRKEGPVSVLVLSNMDKKMDRTGLPSTTPMNLTSVRGQVMLGLQPAYPILTNLVKRANTYSIQLLTTVHKIGRAHV